jgi:hypothetical protein
LEGEFKLEMDKDTSTIFQADMEQSSDCFVKRQKSILQQQVNSREFKPSGGEMS